MRGEKFFYRRLSTREILASPHGIAAKVGCRDGRRLRIITLREGLAADILISLFPCPAFGEGDGTDEAVLTSAVYGTWISKKKSLARGDVDIFQRSEAALASFVEPFSIKYYRGSFGLYTVLNKKDGRETVISVIYKKGVIVLFLLNCIFSKVFKY